MTNAQKWVSLFLGLFIILFILGRATKEEEEFIEDIDYYNEESQSESKELDGLALINNIGCTSCHGADLAGTNLAPGLFEAKDHFSRQQLIGYLRNPSSYDGDERFEAYKEKYNSIMPAYGNINVDQLGIIADYILKLEEK